MLSPEDISLRCIPRVCLWVIFLVLTSFSPGEAPQAADRTFPPLQNGDLLFQAEGNSEFSGAISSATAGKDSLSFVHVAILYLHDGKEEIIEASPDAGVRVITLGQFLRESPKIMGKPAVVAKRLKKAFSPDEAVDRALSCLGQPYDWYFLPDNGMMYCSELVYESYLSKDSESGEDTHIFSATPMNFRDRDGNMPRFWIDLYSRLGMEVPEGMPGTNPNGLFHDQNLIELFRFF